MRSNCKSHSGVIFLGEIHNVFFNLDKRIVSFHNIKKQDKSLQP